MRRSYRSSLSLWACRPYLFLCSGDAGGSPFPLFWGLVVCCSVVTAAISRNVAFFVTSCSSVSILTIFCNWSGESLLRELVAIVVRISRPYAIAAIAFSVEAIARSVPRWAICAERPPKQAQAPARSPARIKRKYFSIYCWDERGWSEGLLWLACIFFHCSCARVKAGSFGIQGPAAISPVTKGV